MPRLPLRNPCEKITIKFLELTGTQMTTKLKRLTRNEHLFIIQVNCVYSIGLLY